MKWSSLLGPTVVVDRYPVRYWKTCWISGPSPIFNIDSVISEDEIADLVESLKSEVRIAEIYPEKVIKFSY